MNNNNMSKLLLITVCGIFSQNYSIEAWASDDSPLCTEVGELMHGDQQKCKKGDIIMVNPMMAAMLCDLSLPTIVGEGIVVCHYLGKKRPERELKK